jgi:hypothetical protein
MKSLFMQREKFNRDIVGTAFAPGGKGGHCVLQSGFLQLKI